jgi:endogenous inhibitor of DNA gyrase (YacG/DUF329 family)
MSDLIEGVPCVECGKPVSAIRARGRNGLCFSCALKHGEKVACAECGKPVSTKLAARRNGLCLQCSVKRSPFFVLYGSLIERVCNSPSGFEGLSDPEKNYYALTLFENEVNNGGFHQFFFNSLGSYYERIEKGLVAFDEPQLLEVLHRAKQIVFPEMAVPLDTAPRRKLLPALGSDLGMRLDELDQKFYRASSNLRAKLERFAREQGLIPTEGTA